MGAHQFVPRPADAPDFFHEVQQRPNYRKACTRTPTEQAQLLEKLRYRTYPMWSLQQRIMQRLGDFGRLHFPWIGKYRWRL